MEHFPHVDDMTFYTVIRVLDNNRTTIKTLRYDLPFNLSNKYRWYFKYRAALLQIQYPKFEIRIASGKYIKQPAELEKNLKDKIRSARGKVTEMKNKLANAFVKYKNHNSSNLFKTDDDFNNEPEVLKFKERLENKEKELSELLELSIEDFYEKYKHRFPYITIETIENGKAQFVEIVYLD